MRIIGITGRARCGKDTLAGFLIERHGYTRVSLAEPLRTFVSNITGLSMEALTDSDAKEAPLEWLGGVTPRRMMQTLGTEWGRDMVDRDLWLKVARRRIEEARKAGAPGVVVPDVRFDNEAELIRDLGGTVVLVTRPGAASVQAHVSEQGIPQRLIDEHIENDRDLPYLAIQAEVLAGN